MLQWGRALMNAEMGGGTTRDSGGDSELQWGRALMNAEIQIPILLQTTAVPASMGPRSDERGNCRWEKALSLITQASMGPRSDERGNVSEGWHDTIYGNASMGPRSDERGNGRRP